MSEQGNFTYIPNTLGVKSKMKNISLRSIFLFFPLSRWLLTQRPVIFERNRMTVLTPGEPT